MASYKSWISALRPRTLFLAVGTSLCGSGMAYTTGSFKLSVFILTMLTATVLQLLSNLANDLGDYQQGTDISGERVGPKRTVQSGEITPKQMTRAILISIVASCAIGLALIYEALQFLQIGTVALFILLGLASIAAAVKYTAGKNPYGYKGLGDIFSFVFFGLVSVVGTYFLHTQELNFQPWLPAIGMGLFTVAVLNINNMRDMDNDRKSGKITVAIKLGLANAKRYHAFLTIGGIFSFIAYNIIYTHYWYQSIYCIVFLLFMKILSDIITIKDNKLLDPYLKYTSMSSFILAVLFVIFINI